MHIALTGNIGGQDFLNFAFYSEGDLQILSGTPTAVTVRNPDTGAITTFSGIGLSASANGEILSGTITGWNTLSASNAQITSVTGIAWGFSEFAFALEEALGNDNETALTALISRQDVTIDASGFQQFAELFLDGVTSNATLIGSPVGGRYEGGSGNDLFQFTTPDSDSGSFLLGSAGNDTYDFTNASSSAGGNYALAYHTLAAPITATINTGLNTGTVASVLGTDTLTNIANVVADDAAGGFSLVGSTGGDTFNITTNPESFMVVAGGRGNDTYNLNLNSILRLTFAGDGNGSAIMGARINLATGVVANDGFGFSDTINRSGTNGRLEIEGTQFSDIITGGAANDSFILGAGNDTLDGGDGFDRVRFDRNQMTSGVVVDLNAGTATGQWQGAAFAHQISNIEWVRGTRTFDDVLTGSNIANRLEGRGGNNLLDGRGGADELIGGSGDDTVFGGTGDDFIDLRGGGDNIAYGGRDDDTLMGGAGND
ncbi:calcium-binding protein, partial [Roseicitreum antarcticum]